MKQLIFILTTLFLLFFTLGCLKEEVDINTKTETTVEKNTCLEWQYFNKDLLDTTSRNGNVPDNMIYLESLTFENIWLSEHIKAPIKHVIYNKSKIRNIIILGGLYNDINYNGSPWRHYTLRINYVDNSTEYLTGYIKGAFEPYTYTPSGTNYLANNHISNKVIWEQDLQIPFEAGINEYRNNNIRVYTWNISYFHSGSNIHLTSRKLYPPNAKTNSFTVPHIN